MESERLEPAIGGQMLVSHPDAPPKAVPSVSFAFVWKGPGEWAFDFFVPVAPAALRLPESTEPARSEDLWRHTCFELFLRSEAGDSYLEFNFSPSGEWAAYGFDAYRSGMRPLNVAPPRILTADPNQFKMAMDARLRSLGLDEESVRLLNDVGSPMPKPTTFTLSAVCEDSALYPGQSWRAGVSAVIEEADGTKSYWALQHPPGEPDFHHPDCFALELPPLV